MPSRRGALDARKQRARGRDDDAPQKISALHELGGGTHPVLHQEVLEYHRQSTLDLPRLSLEQLQREAEECRILITDLDDIKEPLPCLLIFSLSFIACLERPSKAEPVSVSV
ncbi:hypothetical protein LtaPh_3547400 [Leishmania tarentolae]|uniref:Uncharacterized protein n=1 Tax=Leishmania tarentolae TaxID=5689 RepID=A0A640KTR4_LEITA|nr:hypothetical protein LtaPh_3547400 [Leishmania tarentolae]